MPNNPGYENIPTDEQDRMIDMVTQKLHVDPDAIEIGTNGYMYIALPEGVDAGKVAKKINDYQASTQVKPNDSPSAFASLEDAGRLMLDVEQIREFAGVREAGHGTQGGSKEYFTYNDGGDYGFALLEGGKVVAEAQNPQIPPSRVAENLSATLGGMPVSLQPGGNYAIDVNATPDSLGRITGIMDELREKAGLSEAAIKADTENGRIIITGTAAEVDRLNTALLDSEKTQDIALIVAENPMLYRREAPQDSRAAPPPAEQLPVAGNDGKSAGVDAEGKAINPVPDIAAVLGPESFLKPAEPQPSILEKHQLAELKTKLDALKEKQGAVAVDAGTEQNFVIGNDGKPVEVDPEGKAVNPADQARLAGTPSSAVAPAAEVASQSVTPAASSPADAIERHLGKGYVVTENTKTQATKDAVFEVANTLGLTGIDDDGKLSKAEIQEIQKKVYAEGAETQKFDGIIGPDTLMQIKNAMAKNKVSVTETEGVGAPAAAGAVKTNAVSQDLA